MSTKTIIIASGGTGGHLYPTIAVADEIRRLRPDVQVIFIGTSDRIESREVPRAGYRFEPIEIEAPRKSLATLVRFPLQLLLAVIRSRSILRENDTVAVLGGGAYLSVPVGIAAWISGKRLGLLEINSVVGKANKILARFAKRIFLAYPESASFFEGPARDIEVVGTPVRHGLGSPSITPEDARREFGFDTGAPTVLAFGGSLGARALNSVMRTAALTLAAKGVNVLWQTGSADIPTDLVIPAELASRIRIVEFIQNMPTAYAAADLVVCRAGASSLAELSHIGMPAILVPYPYAADNHQEKNAVAFEAGGAAIVLRDRELNDRLLIEVERLLQAPHVRKTMAQAMRRRGHRDAATRIARWLLSDTAAE